MKLKYAVLPAAVAMLFSAAASAADTVDTVHDQGRIYFLGSVKAPTCVVNDGQKNFTVMLGDFEMSAFPQSNTQVRGNEAVQIKLTECTGQWANLRLEATDRYNDSMIKFAETSNSAKGLALGLKAVDDAAAPFIKVDGKENNWQQIEQKTATYKFYPFIYQLADIVESGKLRAQVLYTIRYV
ncbi:fimbrial protein [Morganella psychrotolerans]|uniref:fimbrial protein n=1 Tax=Morganella psychrotolerans TaxID=368603 RepID=UPI0039AEDCB9